MLIGITLASILATTPVTLPESAWRTQLFIDSIHKINYGEVVITNCESTLTVNSRTYRILDHDGKYREFIIDAFNTDMSKEYPNITADNCGRGHQDCPCVKMYLARHAIYAKQDKMRLKWIEDAKKREESVRYRRPLFYKRPKPIRWTPKQESSTGK